MKEAEFTTAPITPALASQVIIEPEWLDIPGATRLTSLGRSAIYQAIDEGLVHSVSLRRKGRVKGKRLISVSSLRAWIESHTAGIDEDSSRRMKRVRKAAG